MCGSKRILGGSMNYQTLNSSSKFAELKQTLMPKCTIYSTSRLLQHFLMSARSGSTSCHKGLLNEIGSERTSYNIDRPVQSVFAENLNLFQVKGSDTQIHTIHYYVEEIYPILIHWWGVYAILLIC